MRKPTPPTYRTTNWRSYNAGLKQRGSLQIWFDPETVWLAKPSGRRGRSATFTDAAIQACLTLKALFGLPLRKTTGLVAKAARGLPPDKRVQIRQAEAKPAFDDLEAWLNAQLPKISGKSPLASAIRYALSRMARMRPYPRRG